MVFCEVDVNGDRGSQEPAQVLLLLLIVLMMLIVLIMLVVMVLMVMVLMMVMVFMVSTQVPAQQARQHQPAHRGQCQDQVVQGGG